jgi:PAS domain S-box-containing protein
MDGKITSEFLDAISLISPVAIVGVDSQGKVDLWSTAAESMFGWTAEDVLGKPFPLAPWVEPALRQIPVRSRVNTKNGESIYVELWRTAMPSGGWIVMAQDLTASAQAEVERRELVAREKEAQARAEAESRFRELLEAAPDGIIEIDQDGRIVLLNAVTEKLFGYTREELLGQEIETLIPGHMRERHTRHRADYRAHPVVRPMGQGLKLLGRRKDGSEFPVEISLSPVKSEGGFHVTAIIRDVTEQKIAEEKIRSANQELGLRNQEAERANRLKSEFLASMSHELRTPLHTIIGFTELLAEELEGPLNEKQKRFLNHVHQDSLHLLELINDILDLSKIEAGRLELHSESFDARQVLFDALNGIRPIADSRNITLESSIAGEVFIFADRVRFREIVSNLLSNAVKFTAEGGRVSVEQRPAPRGLVCFSVADTGIGIAPEDQEAIFDKFHQVGSTTRGVREGTGLGLAIVKRLVEMHGGTITLESAPGQGSRFSFTMPADDTGKSAEPVVLVIEDEPAARELLSSYLNPLGIHTECAATAEQGLLLARDLHPDAITLDVLLPGRNGWSVLRELRAMPETADIPVFVVSVLDEVRAAADRGATEYLRKPVKKEALLRALREHVPARFGNI